MRSHKLKTLSIAHFTCSEMSPKMTLLLGRNV